MELTDTEILLYLALTINALLIAWVIRLETRITKLLTGSKGQDLESSIRKIQFGFSDFENYKRQTDSILQRLEQRVKKAIRSTETVRFNPFKGSGSGGNQSFATALIDEEGDGVVISSLYSRERVSVYSKPLTGFTSSFELSDEEKQALDKAKKKL